MGSVFGSSRQRREIPENRQAINQIYNAEFGYAPVGPIGTIASVPKRQLYTHVPHHRHKRRQRI